MTSYEHIGGGMEHWSEAERLVREGDPVKYLAELKEAQLHALPTKWSFWGRPAQFAPEGDWRTWLVMAGRGFGKTRAGAEWVRGLAEAHPSWRIALVGATEAEVRNVMIEGPSGLLAIAPKDNYPKWEPSNKKLRWPNGARAWVYSAAEPESLRGVEMHAAWADEVAKWDKGMAAWANLEFAVRAGARPRVVATTTPLPNALVKRLLARAVVTRGRTVDNRSMLAEVYLEAMTAEYGGTRLGRQELDGELIEELDGAMWSRAAIEACREEHAPPPVRVVIGVDPPAGKGEGADECGIVVVSADADRCAHVLADASVQGLSPDKWACAVADAAVRHAADLVVAEANNGGAMVESVLRIGDDALPVRLVHASHGKTTRAEPVARLYARGKVRHAGRFAALEDQLCGMSSAGYRGPGRSPDRADALVWAVTELLLPRGRGAPGMRVL